MHSSSSHSARLRPSCVAAFALLATLLAPTVASAQGQFSIDVEGNYPENEALDDGLGVGARFGHEWDLVLLSLTPEVGVNYHTFGGTPDADAFAVLAGGRLGIGFIIEPSAFVHAGIGHYSYDIDGADVSETNIAYEMGLALDFTMLPVIDFGVHGAVAGIAGDDELDSFDWLALGGHVTFVFDDDDHSDAD
jgi:hypothetical protein